MNSQELEETVREAFHRALDNAALEAFGGIYDASTLKIMVDQDLILKQALALIAFS